MSNLKWYHYTCLCTLDDALIIRAAVGDLIKINDNPYLLSGLIKHRLGIVININRDGYFYQILSA